MLPGLGPIAGIALLIPATFNLNATSAIIMLAGIYYGAMYGGSTTSILLNVPGETASVMTCIDGYQMAQKGPGRTGAGHLRHRLLRRGRFGHPGVGVPAPPLAEAALAFGPPEFFSLMVFGFVVLSNVTGGSLIKSLMMAVVGSSSGRSGWIRSRATPASHSGYGSLLGGIEFVAVAIGLFGIGEVLVNVEQPAEVLEQRVLVPRFRDLYPTLQDLKQSLGAILRGTGIGFGVGLVPGPAPVIATYASYMVEKRISDHPEEFGHGAIEGVAGPESANNAACQSAFIPLFVLGIPFAPAHGHSLGGAPHPRRQPRARHDCRTPAALLGRRGQHVHRQLHLALAQPALRAALRQYPAHTEEGPAAARHAFLSHGHVQREQLHARSLGDAGLRALGYLMRKWAYEGAPLLLALVLGPKLEVAFRQSLMISHGDFTIFVERPVSLVFLLATLGFLLMPLSVRQAVASRSVGRRGSRQPLAYGGITD